MQAPLPIRDGISPSYIWIPEGQWENALAFLCKRFQDVPEATWRARFENREIVDQTGQVLQTNSEVRRGMCLYYYREVENEPIIPFEEQILFQDEHLLVVDKPHFLPVTPGGQYLRETLLSRLKHKTGNQQLSPLHRLDRETAGVMLFSCQAESRGIYQRLFQERTIEKTYHAVAPRLSTINFPFLKRSRMIESERFFMMQEVDGEPNSETMIDIIENRGELTLYRLQPKTGKKHQLRLHLASLGAPILNDGFYPAPRPAGTDDFEKPLQLLAYSIAFQDPIEGRQRSFFTEQTL